MHPPSRSIDTSPEVFAMLVEHWRRMTLAERVELIDQLNADVEAMAIAGILDDHKPDRGERGRRHNQVMRLDEVEPWDPRPVLREERADLLALLGALGLDDWVAPTASGHLRVKDVALHLLDDDLGWLSRGRDADLSGLLPTDGGPTTLTEPLLAVRGIIA